MINFFKFQSSDNWFVKKLEIGGTCLEKKEINKQINNHLE